MIAVSLTIALTFGGGDWTLDLTPHTIIRLEHRLHSPIIPGARSCGFALPYIAFATTTPNCDADLDGRPGAIVRHEAEHLHQHDHLGPAFLAVYALTAGQAIEEYLGPPGSTWHPPEGATPNCPLVRITPSGTTVMPCWRFGGAP